MQYYKNFDYLSVLSKKTVCTRRSHGKKGIKYNTSIISFDIETSSIRINENEVMGLCYIWMCCINGVVIYGRTLQEFREFLQSLPRNGRYLIYVHNLSFEFQFLLNIINDFEVFARSPRKVMKCTSSEFNCEFRCTYFLWNCKLEKAAKTTPYDKMVGDLDYRKIRTPHTPLTVEELGYCENDVLIVWWKIKNEELPIYKNLFNIPLTKTGKTRRKAQGLFYSDSAYKRFIKKSFVTDPYFFKSLCDSFTGGYVHANHYYSGEIHNNIISYDFKSSYPSVMCLEKFPNKFIPSRIRDFKQMNKNRGYILKCRFKNMYCKTDNTYLSISHYETRNAETDNGRILIADELTGWFTNLDIEIVEKCYKFSDYEILEIYTSELKYLPVKYVKFILDAFKNKSSLKGIDEYEYSKSKEIINALYGMMCTNLIHDEVKFNNGEWITEQLTAAEIQEKLEDLADRSSTFLLFQWGIFVSAYARYNLWQAIIALDENVLYSDTDSIKCFDVPAVHNYVKEYNRRQLVKIHNVCAERQFLNEADFSPASPEGVAQILGVFENDAQYKRFITLGAKKYAFEDERGRLGLTLAGVPKKEGAAALGKIENFKKGFDFSPERIKNKKLGCWYNENQPATWVYDFNGIPYFSADKYGIYLEPIGYKLGIAVDYEELISDHVHLTGIKEVKK